MNNKTIVMERYFTLQTADELNDDVDKSDAEIDRSTEDKEAKETLRDNQSEREAQE
jgi:hypothetical protein